MSHRALWSNVPGLILVVTICTLDGMVIFATYADCDLKEQGKITRGDQVENGAKYYYMKVAAKVSFSCYTLGFHPKLEC